MKKKLLYVTHAYPGDLYSEKAFVDPELDALRKHFDEIVLVPTDLLPTLSNYEASLPDGVSADWSLARDPVHINKLLKAPYIFHPEVLRALWNMRGEARSLPQWIKGMFQAINMVRFGYIIRRIARKHDMTPDNTILYSMWFHDPAAALARLAARDGWKMATRAHTSDLYDDRMLFRSHSLRSRLLRSISKVFTISAKGAEYLKARYPEAADRIMHHPLGALRTGPADAPRNSRDGNTISFITTARLDPIKSLPLIMDTLAEVARLLPDRQIVWTLIGDGPCLAPLKVQANNIQVPNFSVVFKGALPNSQIQHLYASDRPDWFIMMSRSEGIPISMGEAMAHAIPLITTDVGDVAELASPDCAILLPAPYDSSGAPTLSPKQYAQIIAPKVADSNLRDSMAKSAVLRWSTSFDATRQASLTASSLASLLP